MSNFLEETVDGVHASVQWKGTDLCMDFHCDCGANCHFDGFFAYVVKCPHCATVWEMPIKLVPRKAGEKTYGDWVENAKLLEPDEDHSDEAIGDDGVTRLIPHAVEK